jgi:hypothetical protein
MSTPNPYAAPKAAVADETVIVNADFVPGGQSRPAGNGWTWIAEGWDFFKRRPGVWIGITLLLFVMFIVAGFIPLVNMISGLLWPVFLGGLAIGCRALDQGGDLEFGHLFAGFQQRFGTLLAVGVISLVVSLVVVLAVFGLMGFGMLAALATGDEQALEAAGLTMLLAALIVAALLLPLMMAMWFAPALVVFHERSAVEAMKESFAGCLKNIVPFLVYGVVLLVLGLLALIPFGLGWIVLWPVVAASIYTGYRDIYLRPR